MKAMDTDRFVNDLNRERSEACVFGNSEAKRNPMRRFARSCKRAMPSLKTANHKVTFNNLDRAAHAFQNIVSRPSLSRS